MSRITTVPVITSPFVGTVVKESGNTILTAALPIKTNPIVPGQREKCLPKV